MEENKVQHKETVSEALDRAMNGLDQTIAIGDETTDYTVSCDDTVYATYGDVVLTESETPDASEDNMDDLDNLVIEYASGISLTMSYTDMDWDGLWKNAASDMMNNLSVLKHMYKDLLSETDETKRESLARDAITTVKDFFKSVGVPEINYDLRPSIPIVEEACCVLTDGIILLYELIHNSEVYVLTSKTDGITIDDLMEQWSKTIAEGAFN